MNRLNSIKKKLGKIHHCAVAEVFKGSKRNREAGQENTMAEAQEQMSSTFP